MMPDGQQPVIEYSFVPSEATLITDLYRGRLMGNPAEEGLKGIDGRLPFPGYGLLEKLLAGKLFKGKDAKGEKPLLPPQSSLPGGGPRAYRSDFFDPERAKELIAGMAYKGSKAAKKRTGVPVYEIGFDELQVMARKLFGVNYPVGAMENGKEIYISRTTPSGKPRSYKDMAEDLGHEAIGLDYTRRGLDHSTHEREIDKKGLASARISFERAALDLGLPRELAYEM